MEDELQNFEEAFINAPAHPQLCRWCRYWFPPHPEADGSQPYDTPGWCRRYPPGSSDPESPDGWDADVPHPRSPRTFDDDWCGEYAPVNPETVDEAAATMARLVLLGCMTSARAMADKLRE